MIGRSDPWQMPQRPVGPIAIVPRYIRRNFKEGLLTKPKTRRERKRRARILRKMG